MATLSPALRPDQQPAGFSTRRDCLALWHLLSLDAPTVAVVWTWFIARSCGFALPVASLAAMALAVWLLYAADRLLDARLLNASPLAEAGDLEERHLFHHRHRSLFLVGIAAASIGLAQLLPELPAAALHLYLIEGALLLGWFVAIHIAHGAHRLPKELAVGPFFAAATFIPTVSRLPGERAGLIVPALLFAALCSLNCLFIYAWENPRALEEDGAHPTTRIGLRLLPLLPVTLGSAAILAAIARPVHSPLSLACMLSTVSLAVLHLQRRKLARTTLRAAADLVLLSPLLFLPFLDGFGNAISHNSWF